MSKTCASPHQPHSHAMLIYSTLLGDDLFGDIYKANDQVVIDEGRQFRQGMSLFDLANRVADGATHQDKSGNRRASLETGYRLGCGYPVLQQPIP